MNPKPSTLTHKGIRAFKTGNEVILDSLLALTQYGPRRAYKKLYSDIKMHYNKDETNSLISQIKRTLEKLNQSKDKALRATATGVFTYQSFSGEAAKPRHYAYMPEVADH